MLARGTRRQPATPGRPSRCDRFSGQPGSLETGLPWGRPPRRLEITVDTGSPDRIRMETASAQSPAWHIPPVSDPRWPFGLALAVYAAVGCTLLGFNRGPAQIAATMAAACLLDVALAWLVRGQRLFPLSAAITGLSLGLLLNYAHGTWLLLLPVYLAIGSKYLFTWRGRHVFNPSLFGVAAALMVAGDLLSPAPAYQWGESSLLTAGITGAALLLFVFRVRRGPLVGAFLGFYLLQLALRAYLMRWHLPPATLFWGTVTSTPFLLFVFYMLTDPRTSPERPRDQILLALAIVLVDLWLHRRESLYTLYYAAFAVTAARYGWLWIRAAREAVGGGESGRARLRAGSRPQGIPSWLRASGIVATVGLVGWLACATALRPIGAPVQPGFRLETVPAIHSGVSARLGTALEEVDPRLRHLAKWILSVGDSVAVGDYDRDGLLDLFLTAPLKVPQDRAVLYRNLGDFRFRRIPVPCLDAIVADPVAHGLISGALFVDWDDDGDQDLFLNVAFDRCRLLRNQLVETGTARYADVTSASGVTDRSISLAAQFLDVDRDGRLDLYVANAMAPYLPDYPGPTPLNVFRLPAAEYPGDRRMFHFMHRSWYNATNGGRNILYLGHGGGRFEPADASAWGLPDTHWSLAAGTGDLNQDGWTDLYIANDFGPDDLYLNQDGRRFAAVRGPLPGSIGRDTYKGMNASLGDLDGDGRLEVYVSNVHEPLQAEGSLLWTSSPGAGSAAPRFDDHAAGCGLLNERRFGWGAAMGDLDHDGWLDLAQANGMVDDTPDRRFSPCPDYWYVNEKVMRAGPEIHTYADMWGDLRGRCIFGREGNRVYLNRGPGARPQFVDVADQVGWTERGCSRGVALADLDEDGDLDAVVTHPFAPPSLYRNTLYGRSPGHPGPGWMGLRLVGDGARCSREAIGSTVTVTDPAGRRQYREVQLANGFSAQGDRRLLFGLGRGSGSVTARVAWYGGPTIDYPGLRPGRYHTIRLSGGARPLAAANRGVAPTPNP
jgi:hypothetical protein